MVDPFIYAPLPKDSIRLLTFSTPSTSPGLPTCTIDTVSLDIPLKFCALSYAWGPPSATEGILCNGLQMKIAANLHEAIKILFSPQLTLDLPIWIDAICINQKDDEEKSEQVSRMGDVYKMACKVIVWLGPASEESDLAMDSLSWLSRNLSWFKHPVSTPMLGEAGFPDENSPIWPALGHLYGRSWFGRVWTFQEAVLAVDSLVICGQKTVDWTTLATVGSELRRVALWQLCVGQQEIDLHHDGFRATILISFSKQELARRGYLNPTMLLRIADSKLCSDPRDKVYAMLGMTWSSFKNRVQISYSNDSDREILETFIEYGKACIEEKLPEIFQLVARRSRMPGLPSWCPNLYSNPKTSFINPFNARAGIAADDYPGERLEGTILPGSSKLGVTGFRVDTISKIVDGSFDWPPSPPGEERRLRSQRFLEWESRCLALAQTTLLVSAENVPIDHVFTLSTYTRGRKMRVPQDDDLLEAYNTILCDIRRDTFGDESIQAPVPNLGLYHGLWQRICASCTGRKYFSTGNGRLGLGPPDIKKGDTISVFYGTETVLILRPAEENPEEWFFVGDAFVYGLMELDETPQSTRGTDEVFTII